MRRRLFEGASVASSNENRMISGPGGATLQYDPLGRLYQISKGGLTTRFQYDGTDLVAEYNGSNILQRKYVHGPGADEPVLWYEGSDAGDRRYYHLDESGSVVAITDGGASALAIRTYDEYGVPGGSTVGRFAYTGQTWLAEVGLYYYKARMYSTSLGRFMQTDPIGYRAGINWYVYAGNDPINKHDPSGTSCETKNENGKTVATKCTIDDNREALVKKYGTVMVGQLEAAYKDAVNNLLDKNKQASVTLKIPRANGKGSVRRSVSAAEVAQNLLDRRVRYNPNDKRPMSTNFEPY